MNNAVFCRCRVEYEQRDAAATGDGEAQKKLHSFVLFLGELYLNLEVSGCRSPTSFQMRCDFFSPRLTPRAPFLQVKSVKGSLDRANILMFALNDLMNTLFNHPVDANLICAVKLLKVSRLDRSTSHACT